MKKIYVCTSTKSHEENKSMWGTVELTPNEGREIMVLDRLLPDEFNKYNLGEEYEIAIRNDETNDLSSEELTDEEIKCLKQFLRKFIVYGKPLIEQCIEIDKGKSITSEQSWWNRFIYGKNK